MGFFQRRARAEPGSVPALFLHIQKTAGTSIVDMARKYYGSNMASHGDYVDKSSADFRNVLFVSGHFGYSFAEPLMASRYSFTFLRDPVDRVLSFYYFCRSRDPDELPIYRKAHDLTLEQFLAAAESDDLVRSRIWNSQVWRLAAGPMAQARVDDMPPDEMYGLAIEHLGAFSHVGFTETFEEDKRIILRELHIPESGESICSNVTEGRPAALDISDTVRRSIIQITEWDQLLYQYAWARRVRA